MTFGFIWGLGVVFASRLKVDSREKNKYNVYSAMVLSVILHGAAESLLSRLETLHNGWLRCLTVSDTVGSLNNISPKDLMEKTYQIPINVMKRGDYDGWGMQLVIRTNSMVKQLIFATMTPGHVQLLDGLVAIGYIVQMGYRSLEWNWPKEALIIIIIIEGLSLLQSRMELAERSLGQTYLGRDRCWSQDVFIIIPVVNISSLSFNNNIFVCVSSVVVCVSSVLVVLFGLCFSPG